MIGLAVTGTRGCVYCTGARLKKAMDEGVPYQTLKASIYLAAAVNAGVTVAIAVQGAEQRGIVQDDRKCGCITGMKK